MNTNDPKRERGKIKATIIIKNEPEISPIMSIISDKMMRGEFEVVDFPMDTNDDQIEAALANSVGINEHGPYIKPECIMDKPTEREPMLSNDAIEEKAWGEGGPDEATGWEGGARWASDFYESKITSGELRRYARPGTRLTPKGTLCNGCDHWINIAYDKYCPNCGEQIMKP